MIAAVISQDLVIRTARAECNTHKPPLVLHLPQPRSACSPTQVASGIAESDPPTQRASGMGRELLWSGGPSPMQSGRPPTKTDETFPNGVYEIGGLKAIPVGVVL